MPMKILSGTLFAFCLFAQVTLARAASWSLVSPSGKCEIRVSLNSGQLTYQSFFDGKVVIQKSPLGLQRDDQDFENDLVFVHAGNVEKHREKYELFAGVQPWVNHVLKFRELAFRNAN